MNLCFKDIIEDVAPNVGDSGSSDRAQILSYVNRAQRMLIARLDSKGTTPCKCVDVREQCFALPPEFIEIREADLDRRHLSQRDMFWQNHHRHDSGVYGKGHACYGSELTDLGDGFPLPLPTIQYDNSRFGFVAEDEGDIGVSVHVEVIDRYGERKKEDVTLLSEMQKALTVSDVVDMKYFHKPITKGNVKVYHVSPLGDYSLEAIYAPAEQNPSYRRKLLPHKLHHHNANRLMIRGKLRYIPAVNDTDQLLIGNLDALIWACKAVTAQTAGNPAAYESFLVLAEKELLIELRDDESESTINTLHVQTGVSFNKRRRRSWN